MALTYKGAGVDVDGINRSLDALKGLITSTHGLRKGVRVVDGFGHYAGLVGAPGGSMIATHTDGVGTKTLIAGMMGRYDTVGIDCIAMNVNDVACVGATPISFVDYIAASANDEGILREIIGGLVAGAAEARVPLVGGETAIMPDMFGRDGFTFDLAGTVVGTIPAGGAILGDAIAPGDVILGAESTGLHSNGYTLARRALSGYSLEESVEGVGVLGEALLRPTAIYSEPALECAERCTVHGLAHITGGSFAKLPRLKDVGYEIDSLPDVPPIMRLIREQGVSDAEMYKTFNMGIGFCVVAPEGQISAISDIFGRRGTAVHEIGRVVPDKGVYVNSQRIA